MLPPYPDRTLYLIPSATATIMWGKIINFSVCSFWKTIFSSFRDFFSFHEIFLIYCMLPPTACRTSFARINKACETYFSRTWFWFSSHIRTAALNWIEKSFWEFNFVFLPLSSVCVCVHFFETMMMKKYRVYFVFTDEEIIIFVFLLAHFYWVQIGFMTSAWMSFCLILFLLKIATIKHIIFIVMWMNEITFKKVNLSI